MNSVRSDKAELEELKKQLENVQELEINQGLEELFGLQNQTVMIENEAHALIPEDQSVMTLYPDCKGFSDRLIITVDIKVSGYNLYSLDAQLDIGAMCSCARFGAIPE